MGKKSAGILVYRRTGKVLQVLLVHPGGPFYARKDNGSWSIPKGEYSEEEDPLLVARREFWEETGNSLPEDILLKGLSPVTVKSGKQIWVWAGEADFDPPYINSNTFEIEWPPRSGQKQSFPEADRAAWIEIEEAGAKIHPGQASILNELRRFLRHEDL